ncbi:hypothetical protein Esti_004157 [Eimeria stiedai]
MLGLGGGLSARPEASLFDAGQLATEAQAQQQQQQHQQLLHHQQQQQQEVECSRSGYARLLLSSGPPRAPFCWPWAGDYAGGGPPPPPLSSLYPTLGPPDHAAAAAALCDCSSKPVAVTPPLHSLTPFLAAQETRSPQSLRTAEREPPPGPAAHAPHTAFFCSSAQQDMRAAAAAAAAGLKEGSTLSCVSCLFLAAEQLGLNASPCMGGRAPPRLPLGGVGTPQQQAKQQQHAQPQTSARQQQQQHHHCTHTGSAPSTSQLAQQLRQRQQIQQLQQLQQLQKQHLQTAPNKQQQLLQQQLLQQQMQQQQQLHHHHQLLSIEQHALQRLQLQQSFTHGSHSLSDSHSAYEYPLSPGAPLSCYSTAGGWGVMSCCSATTAAASAAASGFCPSSSFRSLKAAAAAETPQGGGPGGVPPPSCTPQAARRLGLSEDRTSELPAPASFEVWQAKLVLGQRESRPLRLSRFEMVEAYAKSTLCLSCDSMEHKITNCPFGEFVCPNCHRSSHRGEHCPLPCRFCFERHAGISVNECIRRTVRQPLERLLGVKMPLDPSLSRKQKRESSAGGQEGEDLASLSLRKADRPNTPHGRSVYVSNMLPGTSKESLRSAINFLLNHGQVVCVEMRERSNYLPYAFVELSSLQAAYELVQYKKTALVIGDQELKVQFKKIGLACTPPQRASASGSPEETDMSKRSPVSLMAPFLPTGQTVQDVCRLVACKLAQDFGLPPPGPLPPAHHQGAEVAEALGSRARSTLKDMGAAAASESLLPAPALQAAGRSPREVQSEEEASQQQGGPSLHGEERQEKQLETAGGGTNGLSWTREPKMLIDTAKTFEPSLLTATERKTEKAFSSPHPHGLQGGLIAAAQQQLYSSYGCLDEALARGFSCMQRHIDGTPTTAPRQHTNPIHALGGAVSSGAAGHRLSQRSPLEEQQQQQRHALPQHECLNRTECLEASPTLCVFPFRAHQLMPGVHSALCPVDPVCWSSSVQQPPFICRNTQNEQQQQQLFGEADSDTADSSRQARPAAAEVQASRNASFEDLTPFPGVLTSELAPAAAAMQQQQEAWSFACRGGLGDASGKGWRAPHHVEGPSTSTTTTSTSLSTSLNCCESLPSPSSHSTPPAKETEEARLAEAGDHVSSLLQPRASHKPLCTGISDCGPKRSSSACCFEEGDEDTALGSGALGVERQQAEAQGEGDQEGDSTSLVSDTPRPQPQIQKQGALLVHQEDRRQLHQLPSSSSLMMRPAAAGLGSYFEMDVSGVGAANSEEASREPPPLERNLSFDQQLSSCSYRPSSPDRGDSWWGAACSVASPRAFSRRAHQMGLPSLVHALKPHQSNSSSGGPPPVVSGGDTSPSKSGSPRSSSSPHLEGGVAGAALPGSYCGEGRAAGLSGLRASDTLQPLELGGASVAAEGCEDSSTSSDAGKVADPSPRAGSQEVVETGASKRDAGNCLLENREKAAEPASSEPILAIQKGSGDRHRPSSSSSGTLFLASLSGAATTRDMSNGKAASKRLSFQAAAGEASALRSAAGCPFEAAAESSKFSGPQAASNSLENTTNHGGCSIKKVPQPVSPSVSDNETKAAAATTAAATAEGCSSSYEGPFSSLSSQQAGLPSARSLLPSRDDGVPHKDGQQQVYVHLEVVQQVAARESPSTNNDERALLPTASSSSSSLRDAEAPGAVSTRLLSLQQQQAAAALKPPLLMGETAELEEGASKPPQSHRARLTIREAATSRVTCRSAPEETRSRDAPVALASDPSVELLLAVSLDDSAAVLQCSVYILFGVPSFVLSPASVAVKLMTSLNSCRPRWLRQFGHRSRAPGQTHQAQQPLLQQLQQLELPQQLPHQQTEPQPHLRMLMQAKGLRPTSTVDDPDPSISSHSSSRLSAAAPPHHSWPSVHVLFA